MRRIAAVVGTLVLAGALVVLGWLLSDRFQSPAQREAEAAPPAVQPITVAVERGDLVDRTSVWAQVTQTDPITTALEMPPGRAVVTEVAAEPAPMIDSGNVIVWLNDRPVFALVGRFPGWRDVGAGDTGEDVSQLQGALAAAGFDVTVDGAFGSQTEAAVRQLYAQVGALPATRSVEVPALAAPPSQCEGDQCPAPVAEPSSTTIKQVVVPLAEVVYLPDLPTQLVSTPTLGAVLTDSSAVIVTGMRQTALVADIPSTVMVRLDEHSVASTPAADGALSPLTMTQAAEAPLAPDPADAGAPPVDNQTSLRFTSADPQLVSQWQPGAEVLVYLDLSEPILDALLVPQRAIAADPTGSKTVLVADPSGAFHSVVVTERGCLAGLCAVEATGLGVGDQVRVDR